MEKILIKLSVPVVAESFDLFVPADVELADLSTTIAKGVSDLTSGRYAVSGLELLCMRDPDQLLNPSYTLQDYHIPNGAELMLL